MRRVLEFIHVNERICNRILQEVMVTVLSVSNKRLFYLLPVILGMCGMKLSAVYFIELLSLFSLIQ